MVQNIGEYLTKRRQEIDITQKDIAQYIGVSEATISRWESGEIKNMKRNNSMLRIAYPKVYISCEYTLLGMLCVCSK